MFDFVALLAKQGTITLSLETTGAKVAKAKRDKLAVEHDQHWAACSEPLVWTAGR